MSSHHNIVLDRDCEEEKMNKPPLLSCYLLFLISFISSSIDAASSACPIDLSYVESFPWDTSSCRDNTEHCCQTLLSLFGMGLAKHLKDTSLFQLPNVVSSSACLSDLQTRLAAMSLQPSLVPLCFANSTQFVINPLSCAGIVTTQDWLEKVGTTSPLDPSCKGDLSGLTPCSSCLAAGMKVTSQLVALDVNATKCFYFTVLYAAGIVNGLGPDDIQTAACILGLPLASSATNKSSKRMDRGALFKLVFGFLGALVGILAVLGLVMLYRLWDKQKKRNAAHSEFISSIKGRIKPNTGAIWFRVGDLERATDGFSQKNLIGQGGYGVVYKGALSDGSQVAVKKILDLDSKGDDEFSNEVEIISNIRHRNLLPLRGCCATSDDSKGKQRYLVYDYMRNGSLDDHLFFFAESNNHSKKKLNWPERKSIILDVAKGLAYLHYGIKPAIYHRDIKATNILLDSEMKARVADFGLAKQSREGQSHLTTRVAGTHGYLAPEYALYGQLTEKSDVYSFGIVILEVMSGRKVLDTSSPGALLITDWAWMLVKSGCIEEVFEKSIRDGGARGVMERFVRVGILCAHVMVAFRPTIEEALKMLEGDIEIPRLPDRPLPLSHESFQSSLSSTISASTRSGSSTSRISI
ncbi:hypothetical protein HHK36_030441 [Tetracentron sinense]|uniref:non-specific serine/threonine protein kinase n=1 Tax=Tetracentron sinense TaxID=13715 RepID=A0A835D1J9_TETSI|nr:hypothetical protein HHK36_030441 [Tetracentron sinense]